MRGIALRLGLTLADLIARSLPRGVAYALADLGGRAWHRLAPGRRALVGDNLSRIAAATGRPISGRVFRRLVEQAFIGHARYWLEILRAPYYPAAEIESIVQIEDWPRWEPIMRGGAVVAVPHLGNFEPVGHFVAAHGLGGVAPVEETEPRELFEFMRARRASGQGVQVVPLSRALRPMLEALRGNQIVALVADRDLAGDGVPVTMFGHATTLPAGPATLALRTGKPLIMARVLRNGPERFSVRAVEVEAPRTGDTAADVAALTRALAARFEEAIAEAPEQWWAAFQPFWSDQRAPAGVQSAAAAEPGP
jgi:phosphatidylinositol dimannoside acyltransferase